MDVKDKKVSVIGMARSGVAAANYLAALGARVTIADDKQREEISSEAAKLRASVKRVFGSSSPELDADLIVLSPGVATDLPSLDPARQNGVEIISELELACRFTSTPLIAVTGTNGKSTTVGMIGTLLQNAGKKVFIGGNIGVPFISMVDTPSTDYFVLEVSSFQLETIFRFHPQISVILNITPDHMDRHKTFEHYVALKSNIAQNQTVEDFLILNRDDPVTREIETTGKPARAYFSLIHEVEEGAFLRQGVIFIRYQGNDERICAVKDLKPSMQWQVENILAAIAVVRKAGVDSEIIRTTIQQFVGIEHRMEWVRTLNDIDFINDSKATNVGAVMKALKELSRPVILIMGGQDKGCDFFPLKDVLKQKTKHIVLMGEAKNKIRSMFNGSFSYSEVDSLEEAVTHAHSKAVPGDVVLLGPACSSFDMFRDYVDRGNRFKAQVAKL